MPAYPMRVFCPVHRALLARFTSCRSMAGACLSVVQTHLMKRTPDRIAAVTLVPAVTRRARVNAGSQAIAVARLPVRDRAHAHHHTPASSIVVVSLSGVVIVTVAKTTVLALRTP